MPFGTTDAIVSSPNFGPYYSVKGRFKIEPAAFRLLAWRAPRLAHAAS